MGRSLRIGVDYGSSSQVLILRRARSSFDQVLEVAWSYWEVFEDYPLAVEASVAPDGVVALEGHAVR